MDIIPYKTFKEQLDLIENKNINVSEYEKDISLNRLKNHSYYSLINGYKPHFLLDGYSDTMREGTTFSQFYAIKILEMDLSAILLKYLQIIEQGFRTRVSHVIAREYSTDDEVYLDKANYVNTNRRRHKTLEHFKSLRDKPNDNSYSHYFREIKKVSIPPWILLQDANFYNVINLYSCLPDESRKELRSEYISTGRLNTENNLFIDSMQLLREYRNIYAHSKRNFEEKINYNLDCKLTKSTAYPDLYDEDYFDSNLKAKGLNVVIPLIFNYLNDDFLYYRLYRELLTLFVEDGYIDEDYKGNYIFNDLSIYDILNLPIDFFDKIDNNLPIPSG